MILIECHLEGTCLYDIANNKDADQPVQCAFAQADQCLCYSLVRFDSFSNFYNLKLVCATKHAGFSSGWSQTLKIGFLMTGLT